jgi:methionyl-tRNA formyltransferase
MGAELLLAVLNDLPTALAHAQVQPADGITYASKLSKEEALLDWSLPAAQLDRQVRAFNPWPIAETRLHGTQLRVWQATVLELAHQAAPGTVLEANAAGIQVACGVGVLNLTHVQQAGRKMQAAADFIKSHSLIGVQLGVIPGDPA